MIEEPFERLKRSPETPPKKQEGERAGAAPKITNDQVWPPTEPPLAEGIRKREEVVTWV